ncbi:DUF2029 domain-containing protein [Rubrobacter marinus]|uniref:DUF2029 domain-containing protein n=1 Tax=Rubrobacter marinus TaxID=2653852 RepID=A0A6G8PYN1_9ACTN|nr:glycosyltransferase 87 family protein [Rubrobacter marinus]QIN79329.1 DUF2029 domain-containing protein [Rubrobacter marinus]
MTRFLPVAVLVLLLLPVFGFAPGTQTDAREARLAASLVPEVARYADRPTVKPESEYDVDGDVWRVAFVEGASGSTVARVEVIDDTGETGRVDVSPAADTLAYPELSEGEAIKLATAIPEVRRELLEHPPYTARAEYDEGEWTVHFEVEEEGAVGGMPVGDEGRKEVARVGIDDATWQSNFVWTGDQVGWHMARGDYGAYGKQANYWYVWGTLAFLFAAAFWRTDKLLSLRNLDVLAILGFLVSHGFFRAGDSFWATVLWYPPLLYLLGRTILMGFGYGERVGKTSNLPTGVLFVLAALASGFLLALNLDSRVIDVGYAGVVGADRILDGTLPYGNMPDDVGTGDTYGPLNYLIYVPFNLIFGFSGQWDFLPAAHGATVFAFVVGAAALLVAGWRYAGPKGAAALFFAWAVFPYTLYTTNNNTNDVIVAAVMAIGLATATLPVARGAAVAAGFAIKLFPLVLAPLWMLHGGVEKRGRILDFVLGGVAVVLLSFWVLALDGDPVGAVQLFYEKTLGFQGQRESPWTIFTQVPQLAFLKGPLEFGAIILAFVVAVFPRRRTVRRLAAFSAALIIAFQLTFNYWFYPYVTWFAPFVFLALLVETNAKTALDGDPSAGAPEGEDARGDERGSEA